MAAHPVIFCAYSLQANYDLGTAKSNLQKMDEVARILRQKCGLPENWMPDGVELDQVRWWMVEWCVRK